MKRRSSITDLQDGGIDAGLFLLELATPRGVERTQDEIAEVCGCSKGYIHLLEKSAKKKLEKLFRERRIK